VNYNTAVEEQFWLTRDNVKTFSCYLPAWVFTNFNYRSHFQVYTGRYLHLL